MIIEGELHIGTFCDDGTFILPTIQPITMGKKLVTIIHYGLKEVGQISINYEVAASFIRGVINVCNVKSDTYDMPVNLFRYFYYRRSTLVEFKNDMDHIRFQWFADN